MDDREKSREELVAELEELRRTNRIQELLIENSSDLISLLDPDGVLRYMNLGAHERVLGYGEEELRGRNAFEHVHPDDLDVAFGDFRKLVEDPEATLSNRFRYRRKDGSWCTVETSCSNLILDGKVAGLIANGRDVTERVEAERALRESERLYRTFVRTSPDPLAVISPDGTILEASESLALQGGFDSADEVIGRNGFALVADEDRDRLRRNIAELMEKGYVKKHAYTMMRKDGSRFQGESNGVALKGLHGAASALIFSVRNVTRQREIERELLKAQKLESLGVVAGGLAHDFNNILTAVLANLSMARMFGGLEGGVPEMLADAEAAALRARELTQQLLAFARGGTPVRRPVRLDRLIRDAASAARGPSGPQLEVSLPPDLWTAEVDEGQIGQVLRNLLTNACQAMGDTGQVRISAENLSTGQAASASSVPERFVRILVADQGPGVPEELLHKVFDPFFTTREGASGMGLAIAYAIVKNHGGRLRVRSQAGSGATFDVTLPAAGGPPEDPARGRKKPLRGQGKILLVDDEESVRKSTKKMLELMGYEVEADEEGAAGVRRYREALRAGRPFDLVIMDLTIPGGMGGRQAVREILKESPAAAVIVASGYSEDAVMSSYREYGFAGVLKKPFRIEEVHAEIHRVLAGRGPAPDA